MGRPSIEKWRAKVIAPNLKRDGTSVNWIVAVYPPKNLVLSGLQKRFLRHTYTPDRNQAEIEAKKILHDFERKAGGATESLTGDATLVQLYDVYLQQFPFQSENTKETAKNARAYVVLGFSELKIKDARLATIRRGRSQIVKAEKLKASTINVYMNHLGWCWNWALGEEYIYGHKWEYPEPLVVARTNKRTYDNDEAPKVLDWLKENEPEYFPYFSMLYWLGCRAEDCCSLQWKRIGEEFFNANGDLVCRIAVYERKGKDKPVTHVEVPFEIIQLLGPRKSPDDYIFPRRSRKGKKPYLSKDAALDNLRKALKAVGIQDPENLDQHSFRRTFTDDAACSVPQAGLSARDAANLTGHTNLQIIERYQHRAPDRTSQASAAVIRYRRQKLGDYTETYTSTQKPDPKSESNQDLEKDPALTRSTASDAMAERTRLRTTNQYGCKGTRKGYVGGRSGSPRTRAALARERGSRTRGAGRGSTSTPRVGEGSSARSRPVAAAASA